VKTTLARAGLKVVVVVLVEAVVVVDPPPVVVVAEIVVVAPVSVVVVKETVVEEPVVAVVVVSVPPLLLQPAIPAMLEITITRTQDPKTISFFISPLLNEQKNNELFRLESQAKMGILTQFQLNEIII
jgi:hypothetical protein